MSEGKSGAHEWLLEFAKHPNNFDEFSKIFDET
jgi:hypothetical protein